MTSTEVSRMQSLEDRTDVRTYRFSVNTSGHHTVVELFEADAWDNWQLAHHADPDVRPQPIVHLLAGSSGGVADIIAHLQGCDELGSFIACEFDGDKMHNGRVLYLPQNQSKGPDPQTRVCEAAAQALPALEEVLYRDANEDYNPCELSYRERSAITDLVNKTRQLPR